MIGAALKVAKIATGGSRKIDLSGDAVSKSEECGRAGRANGWDFGFGSCVTSIAGPHGGAQLYER